MDAEQLAKFINSCTGDTCKADDTRVTSTLEKWDKDKDGKLILSDFLDFYTHACTKKKQVVWKNLHGHNYRNDLKHLSEIGEDQLVIIHTPHPLPPPHPYHPPLPPLP